MDLKLKGKRALVTGSTRGIGRAIAGVLAVEGCSLAICARNADEVDTSIAELRKAGVRATGRALDVADEEALRRFVADVAIELGGLDIAIANASALADGSSTAEFRRAFEVDLMHTVALADAARPFLERSGTGAFVAIASISGVEDYGFEQVAYGAMKAALLYTVKCLADHWARAGIRANVVSPGTTYFDGGFWQKAEMNDPVMYAEALAANPMGRMAAPEEIARAVAFLASPVSGFTTGANLVVDGGFTKRVQN